MPLLAIFEKQYAEYFIFVVAILYGVAITQSYRLAKLIINDNKPSSKSKVRKTTPLDKKV